MNDAHRTGFRLVGFGVEEVVEDFGDAVAGFLNLGLGEGGSFLEKGLVGGVVEFCSGAGPFVNDAGFAGSFLEPVNRGACRDFGDVVFVELGEVLRPLFGVGLP